MQVIHEQGLTLKIAHEKLKIAHEKLEIAHETLKIAREKLKIKFEIKPWHDKFEQFDSRPLDARSKHEKLEQTEICLEWYVGHGKYPGNNSVAGVPVRSCLRLRVEDEEDVPDLVNSDIDEDQLEGSASCKCRG